jgi:PAS domain S-box-containing protein
MRFNLETENLLKGFLEPVIIVEKGSLAIASANDRCEEMTGYCVHELIGETIELLAPGPDHKRGTTFSWRELLEQPGLHEEVPILCKDGRQVSAEVSIAEIQNGDEPLCLLSIRDLTARRMLERELISKHVALKEAYQELDRTNQELARANAEIRAAQNWLVNLEKMATIGRFASGLAHEVNNPMAYVLANLGHLSEASAFVVPVIRQYLESGKGGAERPRLEEIASELDSIIQETLEGGRRVAEIVRQLHSFSNVADQAARWTDVHALIDSSIMMVSSQIRHRARLERHYFEVPEILCIPNNITQVIVNLLVNAVHAIEPGDPDNNMILVRTRCQSEQIVIEVQDSGCGIPQENLDRIMEPFFTTKQRGKGTGLGLAISASIVQQHCGTLEYESEVGKGTSAKLMLPVRGVLKPSTRMGEKAASSTSNKLRILLVDDEESLLRALRRSLGRKHEVLTATSAQQAIDLLGDEGAVDLVISDLMMPDMNGLQLYETVIAKHPHLKGRIVFMSGGIFVEQIDSYIAEHALKVISKPFGQEEFDEVLAKIQEDSGGRLRKSTSSRATNVRQGIPGDPPPSTGFSSQSFPPVAGAGRRDSSLSSSSKKARR